MMGRAYVRGEIRGLLVPGWIEVRHRRFLASWEGRTHSDGAEGEDESLRTGISSDGMNILCVRTNPPRRRVELASLPQHAM